MEIKQKLTFTVKQYLSDITKTLLLAIVCLFGLGACSSDIPEKPTGETCDLIVSMTAVDPVSQAGDRTRSDDDPTWGETYPPDNGLPDERAIDKIYLYLVTADNRILFLQPTLESSEEGVYQYKVKLEFNSPYIQKVDKTHAQLSGRLVAMANVPGLPPESPFTNYPFDIKEAVDEGKRIPMWGVTSLTDLELTVNETVKSVVPISLLRSVPKVSIQLADELKDEYNIDAISTPWQDFELQGYCQPSNSDKVDLTLNLSREGCFNPFSGEKKGPITDFYKPEGSRVWFYTCERTRPDGEVPYFDVKLVRKDDPKQYVNGQVYLCDYTDGKPDMNKAFDGLVRNHEYQYVISLSKLEFIVSFREWVFGGKVHIELE